MSTSNSSPNLSTPLGLGILGLGGAAVNLLPAFRRSPYFEIKAATRKEVRLIHQVPSVD